MTTTYQDAVLRNNPHLQIASMLDDDDLLILDTTPDLHHPTGTHPQVFGPYILLRNGYIQDVNYHYRFYHNMNVPVDTHHYAPPSYCGFHP